MIGLIQSIRRMGNKIQKTIDNDSELSTPATFNFDDSQKQNAPQNLWNRWKKGDQIFKGKFSAGVTPKITRPILKPKFETAKRNFSKFRLDFGTEKDKNYGINPFISITPQMTYKTRAVSFNHEGPLNDENMSLSPKSSVKPKCVDTPVPNKMMLSVPKFDKYENSEDENDRIARDFIKQYASRGARFEEDFQEINTVGKGNFGSVVRCKNKLDGIEYAIKITEKSQHKHGQSIFEALQEVYALSALSVSAENPYIVRYYNGWIENNQLFIQMEL